MNKKANFIIIIIMTSFLIGFCTYYFVFDFSKKVEYDHTSEKLYKKLKAEREENALKVEETRKELEVKKLNHQQLIEEQILKTSYNIKIPLHEPKINCWFKDKCIVCEEDIWELNFPDIDGNKTLLQVKRINGDNVIFVNQTKNKEIEFYLNGQCDRATLKEYNHIYMYYRSLIGQMLNNKILNKNPFKKAEMECPRLLEEFIPNTDITSVNETKRKDVCNIFKNLKEFEFK